MGRGGFNAAPSRIKEAEMDKKKIIKALDAFLDMLVLAACLLLMMLGIYSFADDWYLQNAASAKGLFVYRPNLSEPVAKEKLITKDQAGWIYIKGSGVDFPVMQGKDNAEYLNKDPYGEFSFSGSIFLDSRNDGSFADAYSVIYGHHMSGGHMFGCLDSFESEDYFRAHGMGVLSSKDKVWDIDLFALVFCSATDRCIFGFEGDIEPYIRKNACIFLEK